MSRGYGNVITYWHKAGIDGFGGPTFLEPVKLRGRWEDRQEEFYLPNNTMSVSKAVIFMPPTKVPMATGGYVCLGLSTEVNPAKLEDAYVIRMTRKIPDLRYARSEIRVFL